MGVQPGDERVLADSNPKPMAATEAIIGLMAINAIMIATSSKVELISVSNGSSTPNTAPLIL